MNSFFMKLPLSVSVNIYKLRKREIQIERNTLTPLRKHQNRKKKLAIFFSIPNNFSNESRPGLEIYNFFSTLLASLYIHNQGKTLDLSVVTNQISISSPPSSESGNITNIILLSGQFSPPTPSSQQGSPLGGEVTRELSQYSPSGRYISLLTLHQLLISTYIPSRDIL